MNSMFIAMSVSFVTDSLNSAASYSWRDACQSANTLQQFRNPLLFLWGILIQCFIGIEAKITENHRMSRRRFRSTAATIESLETRRLLTFTDMGNLDTEVFDTTFGQIVIQLTPDVAPQTVANFRQYLAQNLYD